MKKQVVKMKVIGSIEEINAFNSWLKQLPVRSMFKALERTCVHEEIVVIEIGEDENVEIKKI